MDIKDIFIHEAAHVLVYHALDIRLERVWIEEDANGVSEGMTERGSPSDLPPALFVLEFMAGAAALVNLTLLPFDRVIKKTTSDFCTALKHLKSSSEEEARRNLQRLEIATRGFVSRWTKTHAQMIVNLASHLQNQKVRPGRYELDGDSLHSGIEVNWHSRPSPLKVRAFAEQGWGEVEKTEIPAAPVDWHGKILAHCTSVLNEADT
jgi:hypothetical protein